MKRTLSILLAVLLVVSCTVVASAYSVIDPDIYTTDQAIEEHELVFAEEVETFKYYFLMPNGSNGDKGDNYPEDIGFNDKYANDWYKDGATWTAGIYWWGSGVADPTGWAGYLPSGVDENDPDVFYANVPQAVTMIVWNNGIDGGMDTTLDIYYKAAQTANIPCEYYDPGENENYPEGTPNFDGMIYVVDPDLISINDLSLKETCGGEWYYYYGNGCYGFTKDGTEADCLRDDHFNEAGEHVGKQGPAPAYVLGDVDGDGEVSVMDATAIQLHAASKKIIEDEVRLLAADADGDGEVSVMDATEIQLFAAQKIPSIPRPVA